MARRSDLSVRLQAARNRKGWTKRHAGRMIGYGEKAVADWETGEQIPNPAALKLIAITYVDDDDIKLDELYEMRDRAVVTRNNRVRRARRARKLGGDGAAVLSLLITLVVL